MFGKNSKERDGFYGKTLFRGSLKSA